MRFIIIDASITLPAIERIIHNIVENTVENMFYFLLTNKSIKLIEASSISFTIESTLEIK